MKRIYFFLLVMISSLYLSLVAVAQEQEKPKYEMKTYQMVLLFKGPNRSQDSTEAKKIQAAHLANIQRLANEGKLIVAGPFLDDQDLRGIFIFDVETEAEVKELVETDLAIKTGRLRYEIHPWMTAKGTCFK
ncbi:MAG: hypothetical protein HXY50_01895 [Ignavibacteriaceae bacterium]|nr:hypothetical protein [Ignavibacteriaceae bacterium]